MRLKEWIIQRSRMIAVSSFDPCGRSTFSSLRVIWFNHAYLEQLSWDGKPCIRTYPIWQGWKMIIRSCLHVWSRGLVPVSVCSFLAAPKWLADKEERNRSLVKQKRTARIPDVKPGVMNEATAEQSLLEKCRPGRRVILPVFTIRGIPLWAAQPHSSTYAFVLAFFIPKVSCGSRLALSLFLFFGQYCYSTYPHSSKRNCALFALEISLSGHSLQHFPFVYTFPYPMLPTCFQ